MKGGHTDNLTEFFNLCNSGKYREIICCVPYQHNIAIAAGTLKMDIFEILEKSWTAKILDHDTASKNVQYVREECGTHFNLDYSHNDGQVTLGYLAERQ